MDPGQRLVKRPRHFGRGHYLAREKNPKSPKARVCQTASWRMSCTFITSRFCACLRVHCIHFCDTSEKDSLLPNEISSRNIALSETQLPSATRIGSFRSQIPRTRKDFQRPGIRRASDEKVNAEHQCHSVRSKCGCVKPKGGPGLNGTCPFFVPLKPPKQKPLKRGTSNERTISHPSLHPQQGALIFP